MINTKDGMYDLVEVKNCHVIVGNGQVCEITHSGKLDVMFIHKDGTKCKKTLTEVKLVPKLHHNLFSILRAMLQGWALGGGVKDGQAVIFLTMSNSKISFDRMIKNGKNILLGAKIVCCLDTADVALSKGTQISSKLFHQ
jgi:hypothetical protein